MQPELTRFLEAQESGDWGISFDEAMKRLRAGKELNEELDYIFPTLKEGVVSKGDNLFGLSSLYEAYEYWSVLPLRERLKEAMETLLRNRNGRSAEQILGEEGARRLHSCLMLFEPVCPNEVFYEANEKFFDGTWDKETAKLIRKDWDDIHNDVWKKYKSKFPQRAFFDIACHETKEGPDDKEITDKERYATFLQLVKEGYYVYRLAWNYLELRDWLGNDEREQYTSEALLDTYEALREDIREWMEGNQYDTGLLDTLFPDMHLKIFLREVSWSRAAYLLDELARFAVSYPMLSSFTADAIKNNSQLTVIS